MSKQTEVFMPYFYAMVKNKGIGVTEEQERAVRTLIENQVTADKASEVSDMLNFATGSAELYIALLQYMVDNNDGEGDGGIKSTAVCPHCGGAIILTPGE